MGKKARILVVDDEQYILDMLKCALKDEGYEVDVAADGKSGLNLLAEHKPDLVLLDIRLPGLDGYQVLERIRESSNVPVIMLSAIRETDTVSNALGLGADDYVTKPFQPGELLARIKTKLRRACKSSG